MGGVVPALVLDPTHPNTIYIGTDQCILYKSLDRGDTWEEITSGLTDCKEVKLAIDPLDGEKIYAAFSQQVYQGFSESWIKSTDGGSHWSTIYTSNKYEHIALAVDPLAPSTLYIDDNGMISKSTDQGDHWAAVASSLITYVSAFAFTPETPRVLYAVTWGQGVITIPLGPPIYLPLTLSP